MKDSKINLTQIILAREYRGYTQKELSEEIKGLTHAALSKYEKRVKPLDEEMIIKIIKFLDFPVGFFYKSIDIEIQNKHYL